MLISLVTHKSRASCNTFSCPCRYRRLGRGQSLYLHYFQSLLCLMVLLFFCAAQSRAAEQSTPTLHEAARAGNYQLVETLLQQKVKPDTRDSRGRTALHYASQKGHARVIQLLLFFGAKPDVLDKDKFSPLYYAIKKAQPAAVKVLLQGGAKLTKLNMSSKDKALNYAARYANAEVIELLLAIGANPNDKGEKGRTPIFDAVYKGNIEAIKILLKYGAKLKVRDKVKDSPLDAAISSKNLDLINFLLEKGADPNGFGKGFRPPLITAIDENNIASVDALLKAGADPNKFYDKKRGMSPLHYVAKEGNSEILTVLLLNGGEINLKDGWHITPLYLAVRANRVENIRALLAAGADPNARDNSGMPISHRAKSVEALKLLLDAGMDITQQDKNSEQTVLHKAVKRGNKEMILAIFHHIENFAQDKKAFMIDVLDKEGETATSLAGCLAYIIIRCKKPNPYRGLPEYRESSVSIYRDGRLTARSRNTYVLISGQPDGSRQEISDPVAVRGRSGIFVSRRDLKRSKRKIERKKPPGINEIYRLLTDYFGGTRWTERHRRQLKLVRIDLEQRRLGLEQARLAVVQAKAVIAEQKEERLRRRRLEKETIKDRREAKRNRQKCTAWCSSAYKMKSRKFPGLTVCEAGKVTVTRFSSTAAYRNVSYSGTNYARYQCQVEYLNCVSMCQMGVQVVPDVVGRGVKGQISTLRPMAGTQPDNDAGAQSGKKKIRLR